MAAGGSYLPAYRELPAAEAFVSGLRDSVLRETTQGADLDRFLEYRDRPAEMAEDLLNVRLARDRDPETMEVLDTSYQRRVMQACTTSERVAWRSSHGVGKTATLAILIIWWLLTRPYSRVLVLAPAFDRQIRKFLWPEVRKWVRNATTPLPLDIQTHTIGVVPYQAEWFALAVQATDPDKVEGGHGESLMVIGDEAKGLKQSIVNAMMGTQTDVDGERLYFLSSVPGAAAGPFHECFGKNKERWTTFHTPAQESALVRQQWIEDMKLDFGVGSYDYTTRVEANFFGTIAGGLYPVELLEATRSVEAAVTLELYDVDVPDEDEIPDLPPIAVGIDVAGAGRDETVVTLRTGADVLEQKGFPGDDPRGEVAAYLAPFKPWIEYMNIDKGGIGYYFYLHLGDLGFPVHGFNFGGTAVDEERYANTAAEQAHEVWSRMKEGRLRGLTDKYQRTYAQLASIQTEVDARGRTKLVDKRASAKKAKELTGAEWSSPDWFDSLLMSYAPPQDDEVVEAF